MSDTEPSTATEPGAGAGPELAARLDLLEAETEARLSRVEAMVDELDLVLAGGGFAASPTTSPAGEAASAIPTLLYPSLEAWVVGHFARVYIRPLGGVMRWCTQWWHHPEAITRLEALWRTWETLRVEPLGLDAWLRERLDHHLPYLMAPTGPFGSCAAGRHTFPADLPTEPAPSGWWDPRVTIADARRAAEVSP